MTQNPAQHNCIANTKRDILCWHVTAQITRQLRTEGFPALGLHGDKSQHERDWVLAEFKGGKHPIMLATDVAARGLGTVWHGGGGGDHYLPTCFDLLVYTLLHQKASSSSGLVACSTVYGLCITRDEYHVSCST